MGKVSGVEWRAWICGVGGVEGGRGRQCEKERKNNEKEK